jgi:hypothetical protein
VKSWLDNAAVNQRAEPQMDVGSSAPAMMHVHDRPWTRPSAHDDPEVVVASAHALSTFVAEDASGVHIERKKDAAVRARRRERHPKTM